MEGLDPEFQVLEHHPFVAAMRSRWGSKDELRALMRREVPPDLLAILDRIEAKTVREWEWQRLNHEIECAIRQVLEARGPEILAFLQDFMRLPGARAFYEGMMRAIFAKARRDLSANPAAAKTYGWLQALWERFPDHRVAIYQRVHAARTEQINNFGHVGQAYRGPAGIQDADDFDTAAMTAMTFFEHLVERRYKPHAHMVHDLLVACGCTAELDRTELGRVTRTARHALQAHFPEYIELADPDVVKWRNAAAHSNYGPNYTDRSLNLHNVGSDGAVNWRILVTEVELIDRVVAFRDQFGIGGSTELALHAFLMSRVEMISEHIVAEMFGDPAAEPIAM